MKKALFLLMLSCALSCALSCINGLPAFAAAPKSLGKFAYWSAYQMYEGPNPVCYMSITAKPPAKKATKKDVKRGDVVIMITHRPAESTTDVISYAAGAKFKSATDVTFKIGGKSFSLFTQGDTAWSRDQAADHAVAEAMRRSPSVTVIGTLANGSPLADTVSLKGMDEAYTAIGKACNVHVTALKSEKPAAKKKDVPKPQVRKVPAKTSVKHN